MRGDVRGYPGLRCIPLLISTMAERVDTGRTQSRNPPLNLDKGETDTPLVPLNCLHINVTMNGGGIKTILL